MAQEGVRAPLRRGSPAAALALFGLGFCVHGAEAQSRVQGTIVDGQSGEPVASAMVMLQGRSSLFAETDAEGRFTLDGMEAGAHALTIRHVAYQPVEQPLFVAGEGRVTRVEVELHRDAVVLNPIIVSVDQRPTMGPLGQVYDRLDHMRALGQGRFWERSELETRGPIRITDLLRTLPGVSVLSGNVTLQQGCGPPMYYIDGVPFRIAGDPIDVLVPIDHVEVIEVYRRTSEVPGEFSGSTARCGVIAIWTRRG